MNVHPYPLITSQYDAKSNRYEYSTTGHNPGMTVRQLWIGQILAAIATNPATMLDPETHVDYAIKLVDLALTKTSR